MTSSIILTTPEREKLGVLVNNFSIFATQILSQNSPDFCRTALANLAKVKKEDQALLRRLDKLAREHNDESALRLIEDLPRVPADLAQMLTLVRRCLLASAFLGHCLAQPTHPERASEPAPQEKRLH